MNKHLRRLVVVPAAGVIVLSVAGTASAHVTVSASDTAAGSETVLTFSVPHGCDGSATTKITIKMPDDVTEATPTRNPFYDVSTVTKKLDTPLTAEDGDEITEKVDQVVYTAKTPLPDGQRDTFEVAIDVPEGDAGQSLVFPTIQTCEQGETAWTEIPAAGAGEDSVEHPAPSFVVTAADAEGGHHTDDSSASPAAQDSDAAAPSQAAGESDSDSDGGSNTLGVIGLIAGLLGLGAGGTALARTRGRA